MELRESDKEQKLMLKEKEVEQTVNYIPHNKNVFLSQEWLGVSSLLTHLERIY